MRVTLVNMYKYIKRAPRNMYCHRIVWQAGQKRKVLDMNEPQRVEKRHGIKAVDAVEFIKPPLRPRIELNVVGYMPQPIPMDEKHPTYHVRPCHMLKPNGVVVEGFEQALVLVKAVAIPDLPENIKKLAENDVPEVVHNNVRKVIMSAQVFDCEQVKLPKIRDPLRPFHTFARIMGISDKRRNFVTTSKLLNLVERNAELDLTLQRRLSEEVESSLVLEKDGDLIKLTQNTDMLISSQSPISPISEVNPTEKMHLIDLHPVKCTASLWKEHHYVKKDLFPLELKTQRVFHPHTTMLHFNDQSVTNLYEEPVTEKQICGRSVLHAFTVAATYARELHGRKVKRLPVPVTVQCVHSDGRLFHFGVLQLNTLDLDGTEGTKNMWWSIPRIPLFEVCKYIEGIPTLTYYNAKVIRLLNAFYHSK